MHLLVLDDVAAKGDQIAAAARSLAGDRDATVSVMTHPANLLGLSPRRLATVDLFFIDFRLEADRYGGVPPTFRLRVGPDRQVVLRVQTGMGILLYLAQTFNQDDYRAARGDRPPPLVYSYVDTAEAPARYFAAAAAAWFDAWLFPGVNEPALATRQLTTAVTAAGSGAAADPDHYYLQLRSTSPAITALLERPLDRDWLTATGRDPFAWLRALHSTQCASTKRAVSEYKARGLIAQDRNPNVATTLHGLIDELYGRILRLAEHAGVIDLARWPTPGARDPDSRAEVRFALARELQLSEAFWRNDDVQAALWLHREGGISRFRSPYSATGKRR